MGNKKRMKARSAAAREAESSEKYSEIRELEEEAREHFPVSQKAAQAYLDHLEAMKVQVDERVLGRGDISSIIGSCPVDSVSANHRNHARFMAAVFHFGLPTMLVRMLPWVYSVYINRGVAPEYFRVELEAWDKEVGKQLSRDLAAPVQSVYRWMLNQHDQMVSVSSRVNDPVFNPQDWTEELGRILHLLLQADYPGASEMLEDLVSEGGSLENVCENYIRPIMYRIGALWAEGEVNVAEEHLVTAIMSRIMSRYYARSFPEGKHNCGAVVASVTDEFHELGARLVADMLELDGWDVVFLGSDVPGEDLIHVVERRSPKIVALSTTLPYNLLKLEELISGLQKFRTSNDLRIITGGLPFMIDPEAADRLDVDGWACSGPGAVALAAELRGE
ncbi:MAG: B12-binding domain-containing protein [Candidatus Brocadiia bacterium]